MFDNAIADARFVPPRFAGDDVAMNRIEPAPAAAAGPNAQSILEDEALYFSRRAREELHDGMRGTSRKAREVHIQIAQAYEFRAHLLYQELGRRGAAEQCYAL